ncbi:MAG: hypothetical protein K2I10_07640 [Lachnospiraceae bacterium]|nr:hypothetical protein [Lachnospiraceae bacterium]
MNQRKRLFRQICKEEKKKVVTNVTTFLWELPLFLWVIFGMIKSSMEKP